MRWTQEIRAARAACEVASKDEVRVMLDSARTRKRGAQRAGRWCGRKQSAPVFPSARRRGLQCVRYWAIACGTRSAWGRSVKDETRCEPDEGCYIRGISK